MCQFCVPYVRFLYHLGNLHFSSFNWFAKFIYINIENDLLHLTTKHCCYLFMNCFGRHISWFTKETQYMIPYSRKFPEELILHFPKINFRKLFLIMYKYFKKISTKSEYNLKIVCDDCFLHCNHIQVIWVSLTAVPSLC